jgi:pSer/pThr/pTyr-binding forkhead associated (FHA) protein
MMQMPPEAARAPQTPAPQRRPTLVGSLTPDESPDNVFPLLDAECLIGRKVTKEVAFSVDDGSISSKHAKLTRTADGFLIEDLGSRNGTFVNGEKVTDKRLLADGDLIRLGKVIMTFNVARQAKAGEQTVPEIRVG